MAGRPLSGREKDSRRLARAAARGRCPAAAGRGTSEKLPLQSASQKPRTRASRPAPAATVTAGPTEEPTPVSERGSPADSSPSSASLTLAPGRLPWRKRSQSTARPPRHAERTGRRPPPWGNTGLEAPAPNGAAGPGGRGGGWGAKARGHRSTAGQRGCPARHAPCRDEGSRPDTGKRSARRGRLSSTREHPGGGPLSASVPQSPEAFCRARAEVRTPRELGPPRQGGPAGAARPSGATAGFGEAESFRTGARKPSEPRGGPEFRATPFSGKKKKKAFSPDQRGRRQGRGMREEAARVLSGERPG